MSVGVIVQIAVQIVVQIVVNSIVQVVVHAIVDTAQNRGKQRVELVSDITSSTVASC